MLRFYTVLENLYSALRANEYHITKLFCLIFLPQPKTSGVNRACKEVMKTPLKALSDLLTNDQ